MMTTLLVTRRTRKRASQSPKRTLKSELDLRHLFDLRAGLAEIEELLLREAERAGDQNGRNALDSGVVFLDRIVEKPTRRRDLVLNIAKLGLQLLEVGARLEVRIGLGQREELTQCAR